MRIVVAAHAAERFLHRMQDHQRDAFKLIVFGDESRHRASLLPHAAIVNPIDKS